MDSYEDEFKPMDLFNVIWKRKWLIIMAVCFFVAVAAAVSFILPKVWLVDAIILPSKFLVRTEQGQFEEVLVVDPRQIVGQINEKSYNDLISSELKIDPKKFPQVNAEKLRETNLVRVSVRGKDIETMKSILHTLFIHLKSDFDKKIEVEIKAIDGNITTVEKGIRNNELNIQSKEIEKSMTKQQILSAENKLKISEERVSNIAEEMKSVKNSTQKIEEQQRKTLELNKEGTDAISLLLYSNEVQQNLRYYSTLEERFSAEKIGQENLKLIVKESQEKIKQLDTDIDKLKNQIEESKNQINLLNEKRGRIDYTQLIKQPTPSLFPVSPKKIYNVLVAGIAGLFIATLLAFFLEYLERQKALRKRSDL